MARPFSSKEARSVTTQHQKLLSALHTVIETAAEYEAGIKTASDEIVAREAVKILSDIPVEELNRGKRGFRVRALRDSGFNSVADVYAASVYSLASVYGISEDSAYAIKSVANDIASKSHEGIKIKLSSDNKDAASTKLVYAISKFKSFKPIADECSKLLDRNEDSIELAIEALQAGSSGLRWFFSSGAKKDKASDAYEMLSSLIDGVYGEKAWGLIDQTVPITNLSEQDAWADFSANSIRFFNILEDINPGILGNSDSVYGLPEYLAREVQEQDFFPEGLLCELRRYQEWGVKYALHQERVLLGDEMGLGKTVQAIATMVSLRNTGATHFMVVCPASVIANWCREIRKMSKLSVTKIHGTGRKSAIQSWIQTGGVAVTTYETTGAINLPEKFKFSLLVVDEAHYIKNASARRSANVRILCQYAERLLFMTGTALENKVEEMISLIDVLQPAVARQVADMTFMKAAPQFREAIAPVYYRRKREDVLTELPDLIESREWCTLGPVEETAYERAVLSKNYAEARRVSWNVNDLSASSKATRMIEIINEATEDGRKVIVFSFFLDTIRKIRMLLGDRCYGPINGSVPPARRQAILDEFEQAPAGAVLAAQIQSGGTGLNIQAASVVILCEPQFKPSIENQAISRAYRMGQTRNVLVYRLLCEDTVDERLMDLLEQKQAIFDAFADKSVAAEDSKEIDDRTFGNIIEEEIDRINRKHGYKGPKATKKDDNKPASNQTSPVIATPTVKRAPVKNEEPTFKMDVPSLAPQRPAPTAAKSNEFEEFNLDDILAEFSDWSKTL